MVTVAKGFDVGACLDAVAAMEADLIQLTSSLTEAQFHAPSRTGGWSVSYCIEHLTLVGLAYLPLWDAALREAARQKRRADPSFPYAWWQRRILLYAQNPAKLRRKTTTPFEPCSRRSIKDAVARFLIMHGELARRVNGGDGLDVSRSRIKSPCVPSFRYPLSFSFDLALAHERRHLAQAWQVRHQLTIEL